MKEETKNEYAEQERLARVALDSIPCATPDIIEWAERNVILPGSVRSRHFRIGISPWLREPIERAVDRDTRIITFMKPVQSGGSVVGEVLMLYYIQFWRGFLQYNWSNDKRAEERWASRVESVLKACEVVKKRLAELKYTKCEVNFGNIFFRMQGAFNPDNLDSDSIRLQINEEIHAWEPGHLKKAEGRSTAVWDFKRVNISNAGIKGDQLDQDHKKGTMQTWTVKCPGCREYHPMRIRYEDSRPDLGGLTYDADGARLPGFMEYNYNKIRPTIKYKFPCGYLVHNEDIVTRRALNASAKYSEPTNPGAELSHRSYHYEAVIVDYIDWMLLIREKHDALRARRLGDPEPWRRYKAERECIPFDSDDVPILNVISISQGLKKNRTGLTAQEKIRFFSLDRQQGEREKNELPYWWLVIRDVSVASGHLESLLVYEGRIESDEGVIAVLDEHECKRWQGVADSGDDTTHVYLFCLKYGINAIKGGKEEFYVHKNGARRIFSEERPLHRMLNRPPNYPYVSVSVGGSEEMIPDPREPMFYLYSKSGIRERLHWLRNNTDYKTPDDVSADYRSHQEAEERQEKQNPLDKSISYFWMQWKKRNDLFVCECYVALQIDQAGMIGV